MLTARSRILTMWQPILLQPQQAIFPPHEIMIRHRNVQNYYGTLQRHFSQSKRHKTIKAESSIVVKFSRGVHFVRQSKKIQGKDYGQEGLFESKSMPNICQVFPKPEKNGQYIPYTTFVTKIIDTGLLVTNLDHFNLGRAMIYVNTDPN